MLASFPVLISPALADDWSEIRAAAQETRTVNALFTQEKHLKILSKSLVSKGRLVFRAPDSIRWEYLEPIKSVMLMRPGGASMYLWSDGAWVADSGQSVEVRRVVLDEIGAWFAGRFDQSGVFTPALDKGPPLKIILTPKRGLKDFVSRIELTGAHQAGVIQKVEIFEGEDSKTVIEFTDVELNQDLPPGIFEKP